MNKVSLPKAIDNNINTDILENIFNNMTNSYKIYYFNSIINEVIRGREYIPFRNLAIGMISEIYNIILKYNLNLGKQDKLKEIIFKIDRMYLKEKILNKDELYDKLISLDNPDFIKLIRILYRYVPYRLIYPFLKDELKGLKDAQKNLCIENLALNNTKAIYEINSEKEFIHIHKNWINYIQDNTTVLKSWIRQESKKFLEKNNKDEDKLKIIQKIFQDNNYIYKDNIVTINEEIVDIVPNICGEILVESQSNLRELKHNELQNALIKYLMENNDYENIEKEKNHVDISAVSNGKKIFFELKTDSVKSSIRQAIGQLLEYNNYPDTNNADKLIVVTKFKATEDDKKYLKFIRERYDIPIYYQMFDMENNILSEEF